MRELVLKQIKEAIEWGDEELVEEYGEYDEIKDLNDEKLLEIFAFIHAFRG